MDGSIALKSASSHRITLNSKFVDDEADVDASVKPPELRPAPPSALLLDPADPDARSKFQAFLSSV